jgi:hypothetical protein
VSNGEIDSKDVNQALRDTVWPVLKSEGFRRRTTRTAWRDRPDQVDIINFWSLGAYNAGVYGVTSYSFQLELATHPRVRTRDSTPSKDGSLRPSAADCDFRRFLRRPFDQPETNRPEVWYLRPDGSNLREVIEAARDLLITEGLRWFSDLDGVDPLLQIARSDRRDDPSGEVWGMGNPGSPHRRELIAALEAPGTL